MSETYKTTIPLFIISVLGIWMVAEYFLPFLSPLIPLTDMIRNYSTILASAAWGVGTAILCLLHGRRVYRQSKDPFWGYSILFLVSFVVMLLLGLFQGTTSGSGFNWLYTYLMAPAHQALYSTTAFYVTSAGYRVFRFRNLDASVLMICGMFVLWSVLPLLTGMFPILVPIAKWINDTIAVAAYRGFVMGVALGIIGLSLRVFLHKHKEVLG